MSEYSRKQLEALQEPIGDCLTVPKLGGGYWCGGGGKGSQPATPDYVGAANATAQGNLEATRAAAQANRVNQYTPYGSLEYSKTPGLSDPDAGWNQTVNLSPVGQQLLDYSNESALGLGAQTNQALGRVDQALSQPFDYGSVEDTQDAAYKSFTSRLDPEWNTRQQQMDTQLANQGIPVGSEAYQNAMRSFNQGRNDAYQQATIGAINTAPQTYQLAQALRSQPLNELNALRTGSQVQNPTFSNVPQQATTSGPDLLGATNAQGQFDIGNVNARNAQQANTNQGLASLATVAAMMSF